MRRIDADHRGLLLRAPPGWTAFVMQSPDDKTAPATGSGQLDWPDIDLPTDDLGVTSALADVEQRLGGWAEVLEAQCQERQNSLDARQAELDRREAQLEAHEARLEGRQAGTSASEPSDAVDAEIADQPASETDAEPTQDERVPPGLDGDAQSQAPDADTDPPKEEAGSEHPPAAQPPTEPTAASATETQDCVAGESTALSDDQVAATPSTGGGPAIDAPPATEPGAAAANAGRMSLTDLDPDMARKLRVLRRLRPGKSDDELLAQLAARHSEPESRQQTKKRWWSRGR